MERLKREERRASFFTPASFFLRGFRTAEADCDARGFFREEPLPSFSRADFREEDCFRDVLRDLIGLSSS